VRKTSFCACLNSQAVKRLLIGHGSLLPVSMTIAKTRSQARRAIAFSMKTVLSSTSRRDGSWNRWKHNHLHGWVHIGCLRLVGNQTSTSRSFPQADQAGSPHQAGRWVLLPVRGTGRGHIEHILPANTPGLIWAEGISHGLRGNTVETPVISEKRKAIEEAPSAAFSHKAIASQEAHVERVSESRRQRKAADGASSMLFGFLR